MTNETTTPEISKSILTSRETSVYNTMRSIHQRTKEGTSDNFATIFGGAGGDGNVWNILRRQGKVIKSDDGQYRWVGPSPTEFQAIDITTEAVRYVEEKKQLRLAARASMTKIKDSMTEMGKEMGKYTIYTEQLKQLRAIYKEFLVVEKYMAKNLRKPNDKYDGVGSV